MTTRARPKPEILVRLRQVAAAARERKALDLKVLHLAEVSDFTEYFLVCSGSSSRQVRAISDAVLELLRADGLRPSSVEGESQGSWVLMDYGSFVVHVFSEETRAYYGLERLWADAPDVTAKVSP